MMKRLLQAALVVILTLSALAGCSRETASPSQSNPPPVLNQPDLNNAIVGRETYILGISEDGGILTDGTGSRYESIPEQVAKWKDVTALTITGRELFGLKSDGTMYAVSLINQAGDNYSADDWKNLKKIVSFGYSDTGKGHVVAGLRDDGSVVCKGISTVDQSDGKTGELTNRKFNNKEWTDIVDIACAEGILMGLKADGSVICAGSTEHGRCETQDWSNIEKIYAGELITVGIDTDGKVHAAGYELSVEKIRDWFDIEKLYISQSYVFALKKDGTVISTRDVNDPVLGFSEGTADIQTWNDIQDIGMTLDYYVGLGKDGRVFASRPIGVKSRGTVDTSEWNDIIAVYSGTSYILGIKSDGSVVSTGGAVLRDEERPFDVSDWKLIHP